MSAAFKAQMERALEQAACQHFCQLFSVLMVRPDVQAKDRGVIRGGTRAWLPRPEG